MSARRVVVRYRVKPGQEEPNADLVRAVYRELAAVGPPGLRYATLRLGDGRTFIHLAIDDGESPLPGLAAFRAFQAGARDRCEWGPEVSEAELVGDYRLFGDAAEA